MSNTEIKSAEVGNKRETLRASFSRFVENFMDGADRIIKSFQNETSEKRGKIGDIEKALAKHETDPERMINRPDLIFISVNPDFSSAALKMRETTPQETLSDAEVAIFTNDYWKAFDGNDSSGYNSEKIKQLFLQAERQGISRERMFRQIALEYPRKIRESYTTACQADVDLERAILTGAPLSTIGELTHQRDKALGLAMVTKNPNKYGVSRVDTLESNWSAEGNSVLQEGLKSLIVELEHKEQSADGAEKDKIRREKNRLQNRLRKTTDNYADGKSNASELRKRERQNPQTHGYSTENPLVRVFSFNGNRQTEEQIGDVKSFEQKEEEIRKLINKYDLPINHPDYKVIQEIAELGREVGNPALRDYKAKVMGTRIQVSEEQLTQYPMEEARKAAYYIKMYKGIMKTSDELKLRKVL